MDGKDLDCAASAPHELRDRAVAVPYENDTLCFVEMPDGTDKICNVKIEGEEYVLTCLDHNIPEERISIHDIETPMKIVGTDIPTQYK